MLRPDRRRVALRSTLLCLTALATSGCKDKPADPSGAAAAASTTTATPAADDGDELAASTDGAKPATPASDEEQHDPRAQAVEITRAEQAAAVAGKGARHMGFSLDKISHLFALDTTLKQPSWGASGEGEVALSQDDDMDTAWRCEVGQDQPCVLGLALPEAAKVEAIRLYTAAGPRWRDYRGHPRLAEVRVHTDAGYIDAKLSDGANHTYVRFDSPVETQSLAVEVLAVHEGNKDKLLEIAEVEVYGTEGVPRPPMALDPALAWVSWETTTWAVSGDDHTIRQLFVYLARPGASGEDGPARRRIARATALFGHAEDDYALFERLYGGDCDEAEGSYVLFDKRSRMYYPIGDLGGAGGQVYRHHEGHGFAVGWMNDEGEFTVTGVVEEEGKLRRKRPPKDGVANGEAQLREWGFDTEPLSRGEPLTGSVGGCHRGATGELEPISSMIEAGADLDPARWLVCSVGGDTLYATAPCNNFALAYQLDAAGEVVGEFESKDPDARGLRLRRTGDKLFVELSVEGGDSSALYLAEPGAFVELEGAGGLAVRPPSGCEPCSDAWATSLDDDDDGHDALDDGDAPEGQELDDDTDEPDDATDDATADLDEPDDDSEAQPEAPPSPTPG